MKTDIIPKTLPSLISTCPRCASQMTETVCEHFVIRTCPTGHYECKDQDGLTKMQYAAAVGAFTVTRSR